MLIILKKDACSPDKHQFVCIFCSLAYMQMSPLFPFVRPSVSLSQYYSSVQPFQSKWTKFGRMVPKDYGVSHCLFYLKVHYPYLITSKLILSLWYSGLDSYLQSCPEILLQCKLATQANSQIKITLDGRTLTRKHGVNAFVPKTCFVLQHMLAASSTDRPRGPNSL